MKASDIVQHLIKQPLQTQSRPLATCFAPTNIALIKYWGKRQLELNLPVTGSLSVTLPKKGTTTTLSINNQNHDNVTLNGKQLSNDDKFSKRLSNFLNLFRKQQKIFFDIDTSNNIPTAAGLASSASGFAAIVMALNELFEWQLSDKALSILARMGSGSACRSFWPGFVEWQGGKQDDGSDSFAKPLTDKWPGLCIGLLIFETGEKPHSSTQAMLNCAKTSPSFKEWPEQHANDLSEFKKALNEKDFVLLGEVSERNAQAMHQTIIDSQPAIDYSTKETSRLKERVWQLRKEGVPVYFTQDAGPNLKLIFEKVSQTIIEAHFPSVEIVEVFT
jgi:diphosphomevalonate decarboxylase